MNNSLSLATGEEAMNPVTDCILNFQPEGTFSAPGTQALVRIYSDWIRDDISLSWCIAEAKDGKWYYYERGECLELEARVLGWVQLPPKTPMD